MLASARWRRIDVDHLVSEPDMTPEPSWRHHEGGPRLVVPRNRSSEEAGFGRQGARSLLGCRHDPGVRGQEIEGHEPERGLPASRHRDGEGGTLLGAKPDDVGWGQAERDPFGVGGVGVGDIELEAEKEEYDEQRRENPEEIESHGSPTPRGGNAESAMVPAVFRRGGPGVYGSVDSNVSEYQGAMREECIQEVNA